MSDPVSIASLAALTGVFIVLDARSADQRLALAGQRHWVLLVTRLGMVLTAAGLASATWLRQHPHAHRWSAHTRIWRTKLTAHRLSVVGRPRPGGRGVVSPHRVPLRSEPHDLQHT